MQRRHIALACAIVASLAPPAAANPFDDADTDKNGSISRAEAAKVPGLDFDKADTNHDGSLSAEEFMTAYAKLPQPH